MLGKLFRLLTVVGAVALTTVIGSVSPASAADRTCAAGQTLVVIDFGALGGATSGCASLSAGATGKQALAGAGFGWTPVSTDAGFVCRISGEPATDPCSEVPKGDYWSYWRATEGGSWTYSNVGIGGRGVNIGGSEGWSYGSGGAPDISPQGPVPAPEPVPAPVPEPAPAPVPEPVPAPVPEPVPAPAAQPSAQPTAAGQPAATTTTKTTTTKSTTTPTSTTTTSSPDTVEAAPSAESAPATTAADPTTSAPSTVAESSVPESSTAPSGTSQSSPTASSSSTTTSGAVDVIAAPAADSGPGAWTIVAAVGGAVLIGAIVVAAAMIRRRQAQLLEEQENLDDGPLEEVQDDESTQH